MNLFNFFTKRRTAPVARERLQILLAHERAHRRPAAISSPSCARRSSRSSPSTWRSIATRCRSRWSAARRCRRWRSTSRSRPRPSRGRRRASLIWWRTEVRPTPDLVGRTSVRHFLGNDASIEEFARRHALGLIGAASLAGVARPTRAAEAPLKLGVLTDVTSAFSEISGAGSIEAARMAIADFGGHALGHRSPWSPPIIRARPTSACPSRASRTTKASTPSSTSPIPRSPSPCSRWRARRKKSSCTPARPPPISPAARARRTASPGATTPTR